MGSRLDENREGKDIFRPLQPRTMTQNRKRTSRTVRVRTPETSYVVCGRDKIKRGKPRVTGFHTEGQGVWCRTTYSRVTMVPPTLGEVVSKKLKSS